MCTAFNKPMNLPNDYRDGYLGNYFCRRSWEEINSEKNGQNLKTDTLTIFVTKDVSDSILQIKIARNIYKVKLINNEIRPSQANVHFVGNFIANDSISIVVNEGLSRVSFYRGKKK